MESSRTKRIRNRLELYYQAEEAILEGGQEYYIGSRRLTRADLKEVRDEIKDLEKKLEESIAMDKGKRKIRVVGGIPRDI